MSKDYTPRCPCCESKLYKYVAPFDKGAPYGCIVCKRDFYPPAVPAA